MQNSGYISTPPAPTQNRWTVDSGQKLDSGQWTKNWTVDSTKNWTVDMQWTVDKNLDSVPSPAHFPRTVDSGQKL